MGGLRLVRRFGLIEHGESFPDQPHLRLSHLEPVVLGGRVLEHAQFCQASQYVIDTFGLGLCSGIDDGIGFVRFLERVVDASEVLCVPVDCLLLQPLRIAAFRLLNQTLHTN